MQKQEESPSKRLVTPENFQETCRICFSGGALYDIKTSMYEDRTIEELMGSLINVKEFKISINYEHIVYPQYICFSCIKNLIYSSLFFDQCYKAHKTLSKVYAYLTLYQHKSVVISKPSYSYKTMNSIATHKCILVRATPKLTVELEKTVKRQNQEAEINNTADEIMLEPIEEDEVCLDLGGYKFNKRIGIFNDRKKSNKKMKRNDVSKELEAKNYGDIEFVKNQPKKVKRKRFRKNNTKIIENSKEVIKSIDAKINNSEVSNINNIEDSTINSSEVVSAINNSEDSTINRSEVVSVVQNESTNQKLDIKQEPMEEDENIINEFEVLDLKTKMKQKFDTVQLSRALDDINRDRRNIDLDHCYTDMNVYKNVRYIMPRLNFQRVNDLLYPAPDVAKKKDKVLAGNISKRMASILSGNPLEKSGDIQNQLILEGNVIKNEANNILDNIFNNDVCFDFVKPEYVEINAEDVDLIHLIKQEPNDDDFEQL